MIFALFVIACLVGDNMVYLQKIDQSELLSDPDVRIEPGYYDIIFIPLLFAVSFVC